MPSAQSPDLDPTLLVGLRRRDTGALARLYGLFGARVHRLCRGLLPQDHDAEDAVQEVFVKVFERARQFRGTARFSTWLHRLTVNHCLHRIERERLRRAEDLDPALVDPANSPARCAEQAEASDRLDALLARLPTKSRTVLVLRELEGLTYDEIGEVLQIPPGTVMSRLARAREKLIALAGPRPGEPSRNHLRSSARSAS